MNRRKLFTYLCLALALFSIGGMRKNEDPISSAQTGAIPYKQKMEENKDGAKGAPSPSMSFYGSQQVLTSSPVKDRAQAQEPTLKESKPFEEETSAEPEDGDSWELEADLGAENDQESVEKAVEDEDSWWTEEEDPPPSS